MEYTVDYSPDKKYVIITNKGRLNFLKAEKYSKEAIKLARRNDCNKFIIDQRETIIHDGINNLHTYGEVLQQFGFRDSDRIAILLLNNIGNIGNSDKMDVNSRWSDIKYFNSENYNEAINWLTDNE